MAFESRASTIAVAQVSPESPDIGGVSVFILTRPLHWTRFDIVTLSLNDYDKQRKREANAVSKINMEKVKLQLQVRPLRIWVCNDSLTSGV